MKTLEEMVEMYHGFISDFDIVKLYLSQRENLYQSVDMLTELLKDKIQEYVKFESIQKSWQTMPNAYLYQSYSSDIAGRLDSLIRQNILGIDLTESDISWCKENIPKLKYPGAFWRDLAEKLHQLGIFFKGDPGKVSRENKT